MKPLWNLQGKLHYVPVPFMMINGDCICKPVSVGCDWGFIKAWSLRSCSNGALSDSCHCRTEIRPEDKIKSRGGWRREEALMVRPGPL